MKTISPNQSLNLSDMSNSFRKSTRPFKVQESILGERILDGLKLGSQDSNEGGSKKYRKGEFLLIFVRKFDFWRFLSQ